VYVIGRKRGTQVFRALSPEHPDDETWPGLLIVRTEGRIFFANAPRVSEKIRALMEQAKPSVVLFDCSAVTDIEYTALKMLVEAEESLRREGIAVWLAALNPEALAVVQRSKLAATLGRERMLFNVQAAVERYEQLGPSTSAV
jgi:anti-anti-sigma factor